MTDDKSPENAENPESADNTDQELAETVADTQLKPLSMTPRRRPRIGRMIVRLFLLVAVPLAAFYGGAHIYNQTGRYVTTENAYVKNHIIAVSANIDGRVQSVEVRNDQRVKKGDLLFRLDPETHWISLREAEAKRGSVRNEIEAIRAEYSEIEAEISEANARVAFAEREAARQRKLAKRGVATAAKLDASEHEVQVAKQKVSALRQKIRKVLASLGGDPLRAVELHPDFMQAEAAVELAALNLEYTEIRAADNGVVTRFRTETGEWVEEGKAMFGIIADEKTWVIANLKETQLTHVKIGQVVDVEIDAYPDVLWRGKVTSISPATGAEFSVLPPQNASGNWVKVVQRLPVRVDFDRLDGLPKLRAGMTASIAIDTKRERELMQTVREALAEFRDTLPTGQ